jgi:hypothetical protein
MMMIATIKRSAINPGSIEATWLEDEIEQVD